MPCVGVDVVVVVVPTCSSALSACATVFATVVDGFRWMARARKLFRTVNNRKQPTYQKVLILSWTWFCFILVKSYSGNLTAMIARPKLDMKFTKPEDFLHQHEVTLTIEDGVGAIEYMSRSPTGSTMRRLIGKTERVNAEKGFIDCFSKSHQQSGRHAAICDVVGIKSRLSNDFTANGQCNWYVMEQKLFASSSVMAFQVSTVNCFLCS